MEIITKWIVSTIVLLITAYLVPGFQIESYTSAFIVALVLGILNALIKPVLVVLTLPLNILTLGLFTFVINAILLYLTASLVKGFSISSFGTAIIAAIVMTIVSSLLGMVFK